jgi:hypothetical protein
LTSYRKEPILGSAISNGESFSQRDRRISFHIICREEEETNTMNALQIVQIIFAIATIATGLVSLAVPRSVRGFTGLDVSNARGITEIRAILGGAFIGLGAAPLMFHILEGYTFAHVAYQMLGITYLTIFVVRIIGMVLDKSWVQSNYVSLATEIVLGIVLVL